MNPWIAGGRTVMAVLLALFLAGCAGKSAKNWESQVGTLTYDQALLELGPPNHVADLDGGGKVAQWLMQSSRVYSSPAVVYGPWAPWGAATAVGSVYSTPNVFLLLTFGPDSKLVSARRQYK